VEVSALIENGQGRHHVTLTTNGATHALKIPANVDGSGSEATGGEILFLALATCYCNAIYREAKARGIRVETVDVKVNGEFEGPGQPARRVRYRAKVRAHAPEEAIRSLMEHTNQAAEVYATVRDAVPVELEDFEAESLGDS